VASLSQTPDHVSRGGVVRAVAARTLAFIGNLGLFAGNALLGGIGTSWYMIEMGSSLTTTKVGPWVSWQAAGTVGADPYTRARTIRHGSLPISGNVARTFEARTDDTGQRLHSSCDYVIEGNALHDGWWSLTVYDDQGRLIPNAAERHAFNSSTIARSGDGSFLVSLSRDARPGNWLPTAGAGRLSLMLTLLEVADNFDEAADSVLPEIRKVACR
jgi:hypothetical protein